jgi:hypothetical protein
MVPRSIQVGERSGIYFKKLAKWIGEEQEYKRQDC